MLCTLLRICERARPLFRAAVVWILLEGLKGTSPGGPKFFTRGNIAFVGLTVPVAISFGFTESYLRVPKSTTRGQNAVVPGGNSWRASGTSFHESG